ncbi:YciI family protein [uncultured Sphingomonas sp.]|uniref:YciI family protein n=1 Tax=uncultured Sphingomonas sp. TaxID=158754 RepID=UPI00263332D5|nr:YciI family protein [uncultured Sphingomonas sp.]
MTALSEFHVDGHLCVVLLDYVGSLDKVDAHVEAHRAFLERGLKEGVFLVAGRREPRTGSVILCRGIAEDIEALAQTDPLVTAGLATAEVVEFKAALAVSAIARLAQ